MIARRHRGRAHRGRLGIAIAALLLSPAGCGPSPIEEQPVFRITYQAAPEDGQTPTPDDVEVARSVIQRRLEATGLAVFRVGAQAPDRILVEAAPAGAFEAVRALAGATGRLDIVPLGQEPVSDGEALDPAAFPALLSGDAVADASIGTDQAGRRTVDIVLTDEGGRVIAEHTAAHVGDFLAIVLDGSVIVAPVINAPIPDGVVQVTKAGIGGFPLDEAQHLVTFLKSGALPFPLRELGVEQP